MLGSPFSSVLEFVCLPWSEVCSARVTSLLLLLLLMLGSSCSNLFTCTRYSKSYMHMQTTVLTK